MTHYSVQSKNVVFVKDYGFLPFAKDIAENIGKNIIENLSNKYSQKRLDHAKQSATDALKTVSKREIQKTAKSTSDLIGNSKSEKFHRIIVQKELKISMIRKYIKKDRYL